MCRLLAYAAPRSTTVTEVMGTENTEAFQRMTMVHTDGWGSAWLAAGPGEAQPEIEAVRVSTPGQVDSMLTAALDSSPSNSRLVHLRLATDGFKRTTVNTHPFTAEGIAFAHNGSIAPVSAFEPLLEERDRTRIEGSTDSEMYFAVLRRHIREVGGTIVDGSISALRALREAFPKASFNAVLLTSDELVVIHANSTANVTEDTFRALGIEPQDLPPDHTDTYYKLAMQQQPDGTTIFSSTGIDLEGWSRVPEDTITRIDLNTLELTQRPIFTEDFDDARFGEVVGAAA